MLRPIDPRRLPDFTDKRIVDRHMDRLDTKGVSRRDFLALASAGVAASAAATAMGLPSVALADPGGKLGFFAYNTNEVNIQLGKALEQASADFGFTYSFLDGQADGGRQLNLFEQQLVTGGQQAAVLNLADGGSIRRISQMAGQDKAYITNVWDSLPWFTPFEGGDYYTLYATPADQQSYRNLTQTLIDAVVAKFGGGKIVGVTGTNGNLTDVARSRGRDDAIAANPKVHLADQLPGLWDREASVKATEDLLSRHPDLVGVVAQNDVIADGVIAALRSAGIKPGQDVFVVGAEGLPTAARAIKAGHQLASAANVPSFIAGLFAARIYDVQHGWVPKASERLMFWNSPIVTAKGIDGYIERYIDNGAVKPFDYRRFSKVLHPQDWDPQSDVFPMDIDVQWVGIPKPKDWAYPKAYAEAKANGEFEAVKADYAAHYKIKFDAPSPNRKA